MRKDAAINWVRANCPNPKLATDAGAAIDKAAAAGGNCWFAIGGRLTRSGAPCLLHWFGGEVFVFQLTPAQAMTMGLKPNVMVAHHDVQPDGLTFATSPAISLERFEVKDAVLTQATPIVGRLHYEVLNSGGGNWCVRLDYDLPGGRRIAWDYPGRPFWGKGMIDVKFLPMAPSPDVATKHRGPLILFATLCEMSPPGQPQKGRPISTPCAALVELI